MWTWLHYNGSIRPRHRHLRVCLTLPDFSPCCLYVRNDLLVLYQYSYIVKFGGQLVKHSEVQSSEVRKWQYSQPVVASGLICMVWQGSCVFFNMETGAQDPSVA